MTRPRRKIRSKRGFTKKKRKEKKFLQPGNWNIQKTRLKGLRPVNSDHQVPHRYDKKKGTPKKPRGKKTQKRDTTNERTVSLFTRGMESVETLKKEKSFKKATLPWEGVFSGRDHRGRKLKKKR